MDKIDSEATQDGIKKLEAERDRLAAELEAERGDSRLSVVFAAVTMLVVGAVSGLAVADLSGMFARTEVRYERRSCDFLRDGDRFIKCSYGNLDEVRVCSHGHEWKPIKP